MSGHYIRSAILAGSSELITELGGDVRALVEASGLDEKALADPDLPVPARQVIDFFELAAQACDCRSFGLRMASRTNLAVIGPLWILLRQAETLEQMLEDLVAHFDLYTHAASVSLIQTADGALMTWAAATGQGEREVQATEYSLAVLCNEIRLHGPSDWEPAVVRFRHAAPEDRSAHRKVFGPNLSFDQEHNAIFIDRRMLGLPMRVSGSRTRTLLSRVLRQEEGPADPGLVERVDAIARAMLPYASCTLTDVSRAMGLAPRTLQDHLQAQGRSFTQVKDAVRADLALKYLRQSRLGLAEIAEILGYSELSAFSRSFRRWHGITARSLRTADRSKKP